MRCRLLVPCVLSLTLLASCTAPPREPVVPSHGPGSVAPAPGAPGAPGGLPVTLEEYKRAFARRVAGASADTFDDPVPPMLKSVVVLEVSIDRAGGLAHLSVYRSNGYAALERAALDSVRRAAPFASPAGVTRNHGGTLSFLETFLFRDDGRFRIRSLIGDSR